jgi:cell division protein FtsW
MLRPGGVIVCCAFALLMVGVVMVNSAGMDVGPLGGRAEVTPQSILLSRSGVYMALAMLAMGIVAFLPVRRFAEGISTPPASLPDPRRDGLGGLALGAILILTALLAVYVPGLSRDVNGSHRWVEVNLPAVGTLSIQPSEIAKWSLIGLVAWFVARRGPWMRSLTWGLLPVSLASGLVILVILKEDLGTAALVSCACACILFAGGARLWHMLLPVPVAAAALAGAIALAPYRLQRLTTFLDPYADPQGAGYHMIQSMATVAGGGGWGRGIGNGLQKFGYLPEDQTDFLLAIICEELGIFGAALVAVLYITMLVAGASVVRRESMLMLKLLGLGILVTLGVQAIINMAVVTGWAPTKGIPLPLVSSGGTGWILTSASLGLLVAMDRTQAPIAVAPLPKPGRAPRSPRPSQPA